MNSLIRYLYYRHRSRGCTNAMYFVKKNIEKKLNDLVRLIKNVLKYLKLPTLNISATPTYFSRSDPVLSHYKCYLHNETMK